MFIVAPPRSGSTTLLRALARGDGIFTAGENGHRVLDSIYELDPANRDWDSNRLTEADVAPRVVEELRSNLKGILVDRNGSRPGLDASGLRWLDSTPRNALRVPFLNAVCPDAIFIYVHRDPRETLREMVRAWRSGSAVTHPDLPDWPGPPWSLLLVPGWRELAGKDVPELATEQWLRTTRTLLDDLEKFPPERWCVADWSALMRNPTEELERLSSFVGIEADEDAAVPLRTTRDQLASGKPQKSDALDRELEGLLPRTEELDERARGWLARPLAAIKDPSTPSSDSPLRSVYTQSFPQFLKQLGSSLLVSTYQTGKLICARHDRGTVNTHFRNFNRPMGLAVAPGRIAVGTRAEVIDYRDFPAVAPKVEPQGKHDACFVPRNRHFTGDIRIHEVAFAQGELWIVATNFSCLATLDAQHSFVPALDASLYLEPGPGGPLPP